jgi:chemotaxis response regulator CheB
MPRRDVIVAASDGGLKALQDLLQSLPNDLDAAMLVAIHRRRVPPHDQPRAVHHAQRKDGQNNLT